MNTVTREIVVRAAAPLSCVDITDRVEAVVREATIMNGCVVAFSSHTTCSLVINEWEDGILEDLQHALADLFPRDRYYAHDDLARRTQNLVDDERRNGHAHIAQILMGGSSHAILIDDGRLLLGRWQRLFLVELDEPKDRHVLLHAFGSSSTQSLVTNNQKARPAYAP